MSITFIVPCYNAEKIILNTNFKLTKFLKKNKINYKIFYINDGSKDKTLLKLEKISNNNIKIFNNQKNLGKSKTIINTLKFVKTNKVVLIDCDLPYFSSLKKIIANLRNNHLVIINRKLNESTNIEKNLSFYSYVRNFISNFLGIIIEKKLKLNTLGDTQAGLKAFKMVKGIKKYKFLSKYYFFDVELINFFKKKKLNIRLVPANFKISQKSSIKIISIKNFKILFEFIKILFRKY